MVFVTGCHRSGTSLLASILVDVMGVPRQDDLSPAPDNPAGFFESRQLTRFNDELLSMLGGDWCHPPLLRPRWSEPPLLDRIASRRGDFLSYANADDWVDKDPRLSLTLPAFQHLFLKRIPVLVSLREPLAVAQSLHLRNGFSLERGLVLWFLYNHHLSLSLGSADQVLTYSDLLSTVHDRSAFLRFSASLQSFLSVHALSFVQPSAWEEILNRRIQPRLNRAEGSVSDAFPASDSSTSELVEFVQRCYASAMTGLDGFRSAFSSLPPIILEFCEILQICAPGALMHQRCSSLEHSLAETTQALHQHQQRLTALENSTTWRLASPLRRLIDSRRSR